MPVSERWSGLNVSVAAREQHAVLAYAGQRQHEAAHLAINGRDDLLQRGSSSLLSQLPAR